MEPSTSAISPYGEGVDPSQVRYTWMMSPGIWQDLKDEVMTDFHEGEESTTSTTGGSKGTKLARFDLIPARPLFLLAKLFGIGAKKYEIRNWERGYEWSKSFGAMQRHAWAHWAGETNDPESGLPHMVHVAWHALAMTEWLETHPEFDDRPSTMEAQVALKLEEAMKLVERERT